MQSTTLSVPHPSIEICEASINCSVRVTAFARMRDHRTGRISWIIAEGETHIYGRTIFKQLNSHEPHGR